METIRLSRPLKVNGVDMTELPYDLGGITVDGFAAAETAARKRRPAGQVSFVEGDYSFHLYLGFEAIMAAEPKIDVADLERICGPDLAKVMAVGRFFIVESAAQESSSDEPSESTPTSTTSAPTS